MDEENICAICHEIEMDVEFSHCLHQFHRWCITRWLLACSESNRPLTCPYCNQTARLEDLDEINDLVYEIVLFRSRA